MKSFPNKCDFCKKEAPYKCIDGKFRCQKHFDKNWKKDALGEIIIDE